MTSRHSTSHAPSNPGFTVLLYARLLARVLKELTGGYQATLIATIIIYSNHAACVYFWINEVIATVWNNKRRSTTGTGKISVVEDECCSERTIPQHVFHPTVCSENISVLQMLVCALPSLCQENSYAAGKPFRSCRREQKNHLPVYYLSLYKEDILSLKWTWGMLDLYQSLSKDGN